MSARAAELRQLRKQKARRWPVFPPPGSCFSPAPTSCLLRCHLCLCFSLQFSRLSPLKTKTPCNILVTALTFLVDCWLWVFSEWGAHTTRVAIAITDPVMCQGDHNEPDSLRSLRASPRFVAQSSSQAISLHRYPERGKACRANYASTRTVAGDGADKTLSRVCLL
jgi:hypothetical protein